jgi:hypothetical protein
MRGPEGLPFLFRIVGTYKYVPTFRNGSTLGLPFALIPPGDRHPRTSVVQKETRDAAEQCNASRRRPLVATCPDLNRYLRQHARGEPAAALGYKQLLRVEQCWRQMKSGLRMRPVFHYRPWRIQAHVTISVLALLLERVAEIRAGDTWRNIVARLERVQVVEYDRDEARIRQTTEVRPDVHALLKKLRVAPPPKLHSVEAVPAADPVTTGDA